MKSCFELCMQLDGVGKKERKKEKRKETKGKKENHPSLITGRCNRPLSGGGHFVSRFKKLCLCPASLIERTRLAGHKQSFFNVLRQNGRHVTKVYPPRH